MAALLLAAPVSPGVVEGGYASRFYPRLQAVVTGASNLFPFALFDLLLVAAIVWLAAGIVRALRHTRRDRSWRPLGALAFRVLSAAASAYIWFALIWGLNYDRVPIAERLAFDASRVSAEAVRALGARAIRETNLRYAAAHAHGFPASGPSLADLQRALHEVEARLGRIRPSTPGRPKWTLMAPFFVASGTDGMTAPFFLETLLNTRLTPPERPIVLAHEWAHLSGRAPEDEATFVAVLAATRADVASQYSAWLSIVMDIAARLPSAERDRLLADLDAGPRQDWSAIAARLRSRVRAVERVSWLAYDRYLRAQGVEEGVVSYSRAIELLIGTGALD